MNRVALRRVLDRSISKVADTEYRRLFRGINAVALAQKVHNALNSLGRLQQGNPPDYDDPWVALFYLTWYQPSQINVARRLIYWMNQNRGNEAFIQKDKRSLHIVDFGCGALAMQFAVVWSAAELLERGYKVESIRVDSYDVGRAMVELGAKLWEDFKLAVSDESHLSDLAEVSLTMIQNQYIGPKSVPLWETAGQDEERWLSAIHTIYVNDLPQTRQGLANIANAFNPTVGFMSCHANEQSHRLLDQATPFSFPEYRLSTSRLNAEFDYSLPRVTRWRRNLNQKILVHPFLNNQVTWNFHPAFGRIYTRQG